MRFCARELSARLHQDLSVHIDLSAPSWSVDSSPLEVMCYRQKESLLKKFCQTDSPSKEACDAALLKFKKHNHRLSSWEPGLRYEWEAELLNRFIIEMERFWYRNGINRHDTPLFSDYTQLFYWGRTGPGASLGAACTDMYTKLFASPLTSTEGLPDIWDACYRKNPLFSEAYGQPTWVPSYQVVDANKLSFVNKTTDVARSICTEPSINMWMQLGLGHLLELRLKEWWGIDLKSQPEVNRRLAKLGSISDRFCTIDLESASDSMSLRMLEKCLPRSFRQVLFKLRSPRSRLPDGSLVDLNMVSTMGNGYTFPLQTAIFSAAVVATYDYLGIPELRSRSGPHHRGDFESYDAWVSRISNRNWSVFGDDIIVVKEAHRTLIRLLEILGFVVNSDKTYVEGPFKESCGTDWFSGVNVRPFFLRRLRTLQDAFVAINSLILWSAKSGVSLPKTVGYIVELFPRVLDFQVPPDEDDAAGLKTPREYLRKWKHKPLRKGFGLLPYTAFVAQKYGHRIDVEKERVVGHRVKLPYNPYGLYIAFLYGSVRGYRILIRQMRVRYITKRKVTPCWGYLPPQILSDFSDRSTRFLSAWSRNLCSWMV